MPKFPLEGLASQAFTEFSDAADYFWKSFGLLKHELRIEADKVGLTNFDDPLALRRLDKISALRWARESVKIKQTFSYLIANGNLFAASSLFETYMVLLCKELEKTAGVTLRDCKGTGLDRYFAFIRKCKLEPGNVWLYNETVSIIAIRNCLYHANGLIEISRERERIEAITTNKLYFEPLRRRKSASATPLDPTAQIVPQPIGPQLQINELFAWYAVCVFRNFFCEMHKRCREAFPVADCTSASQTPEPRA